MFATQRLVLELGLGLALGLVGEVKSSHWKNASQKSTPIQKVHICMNLNGRNLHAGKQ